MAFKCSICITTYLGRFETFFKPLIKMIHFLFPDYDVLVWINGHYDNYKQLQYLRKITLFLSRYSNIRYITNYSHQPLAQGWNLLILMASQKYVLILNDDIGIDFEFRRNLARLRPTHQIFTLNDSFSYFVIDKDLIKEVGWFDERFVGISYEDTDYLCRMAMRNIPLGNTLIHGLHDYPTIESDPTWLGVSKSEKRHTKANRLFFYEKWGIRNDDPHPEVGMLAFNYVGMEWKVKLNPEVGECETTYPLAILENLPARKLGRFSCAGALARAVSLGQSLVFTGYRTAKRFLKKYLRNTILLQILGQSPKQ